MAPGEGKCLTRQVHGNVGLTTHVYDAANQLLTQAAGTARTTYSYDNCGNRTQQNAFAGITFYAWDENSRLANAHPPGTPVTLSYDAAGRRVRKLVGGSTRNFIHDFEKVLQETDGTNTTQKEYTSTEGVYGDLVSEFASGACLPTCSNLIPTPRGPPGSIRVASVHVSGITSACVLCAYYARHHRCHRYSHCLRKLWFQLD